MDTRTQGIFMLKLRNAHLGKLVANDLGYEQLPCKYCGLLR
jgi:hypothetical protein